MSLALLPRIASKRMSRQSVQKTNDWCVKSAPTRVQTRLRDCLFFVGLTLSPAEIPEQQNSNVKAAGGGEEVGCH